MRNPYLNIIAMAIIFKFYIIIKIYTFLTVFKMHGKGIEKENLN